MCPLYILGLIGPGWDAAPLEAELLIQADRLVGGEGAVLVIDDTALPKKGNHSASVAPQYASVLGKTANCQTLGPVINSPVWVADGDVPPRWAGESRLQHSAANRCRVIAADSGAAVSSIHRRSACGGLTDAAVWTA